MVAQWCQSTKSIKLDDVVERLDAIAKQVLVELKRRNSEHPAVKPSSLPLTSPDEGSNTTHTHTLTLLGSSCDNKFGFFNCFIRFLQILLAEFTLFLRTKVFFYN